jgi:hypothetical protein
MFPDPAPDSRLVESPQPAIRVFLVERVDPAAADALWRIVLGEPKATPNSVGAPSDARS